LLIGLLTAPSQPHPVASISAVHSIAVLFCTYLCCSVPICVVPHPVLHHAVLSVSPAGHVW
jgi:hypothetical protein